MKTPNVTGGKRVARVTVAVALQAHRDALQIAYDECDTDDTGALAYGRSVRMSPRELFQTVHEERQRAYNEGYRAGSAAAETIAVPEGRGEVK